MRSLKTKASRFFKDVPSQDERAANATDSMGSNTDFDAGIQDRSARKKPSRFFLRRAEKRDKPLPAPPSNASSVTLVARQVCVNELDCDEPNDVSRREDEGQVIKEKTQPFLPASSGSSVSQQAMKAVDDSDAPKIKPQSSFATLRVKSSRFFRSANSTPSSPPRPPIPQIPIETPAPAPRRPSLTPTSSSRDSLISITKPQGRAISISRPVILSQLSSPPIPENHVTVPFNKPAGPPPPRPPRPASLAEDTLAFMRETGTRMVLLNPHRISASTATDSTPRSATSSMEARLGLPSGHRIKPRSISIDSPLAARFPSHSFQPLPVRDSAGSVHYSRFSEFVTNQVGGYAGDGVDEADRDVGPIEMYRKSKEGDWTLVKRVSKGPKGDPGMCFRDRWGKWHFVADV